MNIHNPMRPADLRRLSELDDKSSRTAEEDAELALLYDRMVVDAERRDMAGNAFRDADGKVYSPATERRLRRILHVRQWQGKRERQHFERVLTAVEAGGNIFAPISADVWVVQYNGSRTLINEYRGIAYIHALLERGPQNDPANGLTPRELCGICNPLPPGASPAVEQGEHTPTPGTDADGRAIDYQDAQESRGYSQAVDRGFRITPEQYAAAVRELKEQLQDAIKNGDTKEAKTVRKALRELGEGDPKRKRLPPDRNRERMRDSVRQAIARALDEIKKHHPSAAEHLKKHLVTEGGRWRYTGNPFTT